MSGGSYDYLCHSWDLSDLLEKRGALTRMSERLERLGYAKDAAMETRSLVAELHAIEVRIEVTLRRLRDVWQAVEWWDSSDWSEEQVKEALSKYRGALNDGRIVTQEDLDDADQWADEIGRKLKLDPELNDGPEGGS